MQNRRVEVTGPEYHALASLLCDRVLGNIHGAAREHEIYVHLKHRLSEARDKLIPWLNQFVPMESACVLEVGAGTGSSVIAFAEQCRHIDALDILDGHLDVTRARVAAHGLDEYVSIHCRNATDDLSEIASAPYDLIVFAASLEHMLYAERIAALRVAWRHLRPAGVLCIYETPNRLWYEDGHTSQALFNNWLPDQLAIDYASRTPRGGYNAERLTEETLYRWGRGVSFHEIEVALGLDNTELLQSMHEYLAPRHPGFIDRYETPAGQRYRALLAELAPEVAPAFTEETLNLAMRKAPEG
jgi:S-adenosylmethionine-dependent methyltransferase